MADKLKPCKFCGESLYHFAKCANFLFTSYFIACDNCQYETDDYRRPEEAAREWNRRAGYCPDDKI